MAKIQVVTKDSVGHGFVPQEFLAKGCDEYTMRNLQSNFVADEWRKLSPNEIETLVKNGNTSDDWSELLVTDEFDARQIKNCEFFGLVRIARVSDVSLKHHDLTVPVGITNSRIISCDIGNDTAIHNVRHLSHYIIGDNVMLLNIDEMHTSDYAKFGNGFLKQGEDESVRIWLDLGNEAGGRSVAPFDGMTPGDAYLWSRRRDDTELMNRLLEITQNQFDPRRGYYGEVAPNCVIKNSRIVKDVKVGPCAYIKGANKLKNLTINSSEAEPTQIGEGVELVNGIIASGCHIFYGCKAVRFIMGTNSNLKYGARLINSYLGDNSTVSCCEILYNLIFPAHEQHHNNSFLTASLVMGQSNIAAGATIGSNHNSRSNDGEIIAGRGFWPGLCTTLKHSSRFASFTLIAKGDYPSELDITLPFALLSNDTSNDQLCVIPAYWWLYNMYALARNSWKFNARDKRQVKVQNVEFDYLAPDTAEEMTEAMRLLELWTGKAVARSEGQNISNDDELTKLGRAMLSDKTQSETVDALKVLGENMEHSRRNVVILKVRKAWNAYRDMLHFYGVRNLMDYMAASEKTRLADMVSALNAPRESRWMNVGGQIVLESDFEAVCNAIKEKTLDDWPTIHEAFDRLWEKYPTDKQQHAFATLLQVMDAKTLTSDVWNAALDKAVDIQKYVCDQTYKTRLKDFENHFRQTTFRNNDEMLAVVGTIEDNSFVKQVREETQAFEKLVGGIKRRG